MNNLAIIRIEKGKGSPSGLIAHIDRTASEEVALKDYPHVDKSKIKDNIEFTDNYGKSGQSCIDEIMKNGYKSKRKIREDTVRYANGILTASPEIMKKIQEQGMLEQWTEANVNWLKEKYGKDNFVRISLHLDESTPHIQFVFVPLTADGRLSAKEVIGDKNDLSKLQTDYAAAMAKFGIERGEFKSKAQHHHYKEFHELINKNKQKLEELPTPNFLNYSKVHEQAKAIISNTEEKIFQKEIKHNAEINHFKAILINEKKMNNNITDRKEKVAQIKENVHCTDFFKHLCDLGILEYEKKEGNNFIFRKKGQNTGSIVVSLKKNKWNDFADGRQSDVFDACKIFLNKDFNDSLKYLENFTGTVFEPFKIVDTEIHKTIPIEVKMEIDRTTNIPLLEYADERGISRKTLDYSAVKELHYGYDSVENEEIKKNNFFAFGLKNQSEGYSIRNRNHKRTIGKQDISIIKGSSITSTKDIFISEGMFDYLSLLELKYLGNHIVLNSTSNLEKLKNYNLKDFKLHLALNYDEAGRKASEELKKIYPNAVNLTENLHNKYLKSLEKWDYNEVLKILKSHQEQKHQNQINNQLKR